MLKQELKQMGGDGGGVLRMYGNKNILLFDVNLEF